MTAQIRILSGPESGRLIPITEGEPQLIGRISESDIQIRDPSISRAHCQILIKDGQVVVCDTASKYGTFVDNQKITEVELTGEQVIRIGQTEFKVELSDWQSSDTIAPGAMQGKQPTRVEAKKREPTRVESPNIPPPELNPPKDLADEIPTAKVGTLPLLTDEKIEDLIGYLIKQFQLISLISKGEAGPVFRAVDIDKKQHVAVKLLWPEYSRDEEEVQRFVRAMKTMIPLKHSHLIEVLGAGKTGPYCWVAMEFVDGKTLDALVEESRSHLDWKFTVRIGIHICRALLFAHHHHIVHRNITPKNILVRSSDQVAKLGDLLLAKALEGELAKQITKANQLLGDFSYLSPERTSGGDSVTDERSDIYGLGATLYFLLTGQPPLKGNSIPDTILKIRSDKPSPVRKFQPKVPAELEQIIMKTLSKKPEQRYPSTVDLMKALQEVATKQQISC